MSDGSAVKIWKGFTFGSLMSTAFTLATFVVAVIGIAITITNTYGAIMQRFQNDERTAYWAHRELMGELCTINRRLDPTYACPAIPPYREGGSADAAPAALDPPG